MLEASSSHIMFFDVTRSSQGQKSLIKCQKIIDSKDKNRLLNVKKLSIHVFLGLDKSCSKALITCQYTFFSVLTFDQRGTSKNMWMFGRFL